MASETGIINSALRKLGATRIVNRTDGSVSANIADDLFNDVRDRMLRSGKWNFAITRAQLARSGTSDISIFNYIYARPANWLKGLAAWDNDQSRGVVDFLLENEGYHTSAEEFYIRYIKFVTDANVMTVDFREALAWELAKQMSTPIKTGKAIRDRLEKDSEGSLSHAKSMDAQEDLPEQQPEGFWVDDRAR
jgi:hypothetical protein